MKDVIIIGGGIVGLCCAFHLLEAGLQVTIMDKGDFTAGCSYGNAGMIVPSHFIPLASPGMLSTGIQWMFKKKSPFFIKPRLNLELTQWLLKFMQSSNAHHVQTCAPVLSDLHQESKLMYKQWSQLPGFDFELQEKGILMLYQTAKAERDELETAEKADGLGIETNILGPGQLQQLDPGTSFSVRGGIHYTGDATFSPDVFMKQMLAFLKSRGVEFISNTEILGLHDLGKEGGELKSREGEIFKAKYIVVAAGAWAGKLMKGIGPQFLMQGGKGYSMTIDQPNASPSIPSLLHEARVSLTPMGHRLRIGGTLEISGWDNKVREEKIKWILESLPRYYPELKISRPENIWFGYRPCTPDGMPFIGKIKPGSSIVLATGHGMMGVSLAPVTGRLVKDVILKNVLIPSVLSPERR
jgi:D-amino-acid dehydrogenase